MTITLNVTRTVVDSQNNLGNGSRPQAGSDRVVTPMEMETHSGRFSSSSVS